MDSFRINTNWMWTSGAGKRNPGRVPKQKRDERFPCFRNYTCLKENYTFFSEYMYKYRYENVPVSLMLA